MSRFQQIKSELSAVGVSIKRTENAPEVRVNFTNGKESTAYYTEDLEDALGTGKIMAERNDRLAKIQTRSKSHMTDKQQATLSMLTPDRILKVYSGRPGCACGCRGKYSYNSQRLAEGTAHRGYVVRSEEANDRQIARILHILQAAPSDQVRADRNGEWFAYQLSETKTYTVYVSKRGGR